MERPVQGRRRGRENAGTDLRPSKRTRRSPSNRAQQTPANNGLAGKRVARACDQCRATKNRCDGHNPRCKYCTNHGYECSYGTQSKKRGLPTGYVRILEALWALVFENVPQSKETTLNLLKESRVQFDEDGKVTLHSHRVRNSKALRNIWADSLVKVEIDRMVSSIESDGVSEAREISTSGDLISSMEHLAGTTDMTLLSWRPPDTHQKADNWPLVSTSTSQILIPRVSHDPQPSSDQAMDRPGTNEVPEPTDRSQAVSLTMTNTSGQLASLPHDAFDLLDVYSKYHNCWIPIVPKHVLVRIFYTYEDVQETAEQALIWAVMAIARVDELEVSNSPSTPSAVSYYERARHMVSGITASQSLAHAQTLLLLVLFDMNRSYWSSAYLLIGQAVRVLLLQIHETSMARSLNGPKSESVKVQKRVVLAAFGLDTLIAARLGVTTHLRSSDILETTDIYDDGLEEWDSWPGPISSDTAQGSHYRSHRRPIRALSTFRQWSKLLQILNDMIWTSRHSHTTREDGQTWLRSLEEWLSNLPDHCHFLSRGQHPEVEPSLLPPVSNLSLTYDLVATYQKNVYMAALGQPLHTASTQLPEPKVTYSRCFGPHVCHGLLAFYDSERLKQDTRSAATGLEANIYMHSNAITGQLQLPSDRNQVQQSRFDDQSYALHDGVVTHTSQHPSTELDRGDGNPQPSYNAGGRISDDYRDTMSVAASTPLSIATKATQGQRLPMSEGNSAPRNDRVDLSMGPNFEDHITVESFLDEMSAMNDQDYNEMSSQFMQNLGFYGNVFPS